MRDTEEDGYRFKQYSPLVIRSELSWLHQDKK